MANLKGKPNHPSVDAITIRLDAIGDTPIHAGSADPAMIANVVQSQLRSRGYLQDDGAVFVDMDQLLGQTEHEVRVREGASND